MAKFHVNVEIEIDDAVNSDEAAAIVLDILRNREFNFTVVDESGKEPDQTFSV